MTLPIKITNPHGPNVTIMLPGGCAAKCSFCFWDRAAGRIEPPEDYVQRLEKVLLRLPPQFRVLSISGGEPTESDYFAPVISMLARLQHEYSRFERIVLTTNGSRLLEQYKALGLSAAAGKPTLNAAINFINISRHGLTDGDNLKAFGFKKAPRKGFGPPSSADLKRIISLGIPVTLNCVIPNGFSDLAFIEGYLRAAVNLFNPLARSPRVSFRTQAAEGNELSSVAPTPAERQFVAKYGQGETTKCPVCRGRTILTTVKPPRKPALRVLVNFKGSCEEPSVATNGIFELVIGPDAKVYADWGMHHRVKKPALTALTEQAVIASYKAAKPAPVREYIYIGGGGGGGGCGSHSRGSGCGSLGGGGCGSSGGGCGR